MSYVVSPEGLDTAGCISYWRLSGAVSLQDLTAAWAAQGLDTGLLPEVPEKAVALRRAVLSLAGKRRLVRPLEVRGTWVVQDETIVQRTGHQSVEHVDVIHVAWNPGGWVETKQCDGGLTAFDVADAALRAAYGAQQGLLDPTDVGRWLVALANSRSAVSMRDTGGVYFVPRDACAFWSSAVQALQNASNQQHRVFQIPALRNDEAVDAILDAVTQDAIREIAVIEGDLLALADAAEAGKDAPIGVRALKARAVTCGAVLEKIARYEDLLGARLPDITSRVETLRANVAAAQLIAEGA